MKEITELKEFCRAILRLAGQGYTHYKINEIPSEKYNDIHKRKRIIKKVSEQYVQHLTKDQRYYKKSKGMANYGAFEYKSKIYLFKTNGTPLGDEENGFNPIPKNLELEISEYLTLVLYRDERNKLTFRLLKENYRSLKTQIKIIFINGKGADFHIIQNKIRNLPRYRGIGKQKGELFKYITKLKKRYRRNWQINIF